MTSLAPTLGGLDRTTKLKSRSSGRPQNGFALWALLILLVLAPLPLASARPFLSALWTSYIGLVALIFFVWQWRSDAALRVSPLDLKVPTALVFLTLGALVLQLLPIGAVPIIAMEGSDLTARQLSVAPGQTILMLARQLTYALVAILVLQLGASERRRPFFLNALIVIILAYAAYGLLALRMGDTILGLPKWAYLGSITGSFVNRNSFATFVGLGAVLSLAHLCALVRRQAQRHRDDGLITGLLSGMVLYAAAYLFALLIVVGTQSRMGLFATLAGSAVVILVTLISIRRLGLILLVAPFAVGTLIGLFWLLGGGLLERIEWQGFGSNSRILLYQQVVDLIALRPWTGFGGGSFEVVFPLVHQLPLTPDVTWNLAHNTYLALWSELGLIAGSFLILAVAYVAFRLIRGLITGTGSWTAQIAALGVIVQVAIHATVDFSLEIPANTLMFVAIVATGLASTIEPTSQTGKR
jgi:O-antigen ligase